MTSKAMSTTQAARFTKFCEEQGIKVVRMKKGLMLRFPDGSSTVQHFTTSDVRAVQNQIARFRRAGVIHPDDPRPSQKLPDYITQGNVSKTTQERLLAYMERDGYPDSVTANGVANGTGMEQSVINRALYHMGFTPGVVRNRRYPRQWYTPDSILELKDGIQQKQEAVVEKVIDKPSIVWEDPTTDMQVEVSATVTPTVVHDPVVGEPEPQPERVLVELPADVAEDIANEEPVEEVDYIDERNSWVVDPVELFGDAFLGYHASALRVLKALGMKYEIRVWKEES
jgi:hypothetical protein